MLDKSKKKKRRRRELVSCLFLLCQLIANIQFHADCLYCSIFDETVAI